MDPITQGALGAAVAASFHRTKPKAAVVVAGALGGMAADLDVLIRSESDPLLFLEYHRHFTHSLAFIPVGGLLVALFLWLLGQRRRRNFSAIYRDATIGYATHGLLDACTSYGTQLYWPFTNARVAWNSIAIIDLGYTGPLLLGLAALLLARSSWRWDRIGLTVAMLYLAAGFGLNLKAESAGRQLAESRGHRPARLTAKPSLGNLLLWRSIYEHEGLFHIDAIRVTPFGPSKVYPGATAQKITKPPPDWSDQLALDFERFRWFSDDSLAWHPDEPGVLGDVRYAAIPNRVAPLWGIRASAQGAAGHAEYVVARRIADGDFQEFWRMLRGR